MTHQRVRVPASEASWYSGRPGTTDGMGAIEVAAFLSASTRVGSTSMMAVVRCSVRCRACRTMLMYLKKRRGEREMWARSATDSWAGYDTSGKLSLGH